MDDWAEDEGLEVEMNCEWEVYPLSSGFKIGLDANVILAIDYVESSHAQCSCPTFSSFP